MITLRPSQERGQANHGWLKSQHTFSFARYYDPKHMGVSALCVINDDHVAPGKGFATHSHDNMEIISYVKNGVLEHKDNMGNVESLPAGEFQLMSAGTGVTHSEYNPSGSEPVEFLQIWIEPNEQGIDPGYQQKQFDQVDGFQLIASPTAENGSLKLHQDARLYQLRLNADANESYQLDAQRKLYIHMVAGELSVNGQTLKEGDGATLNSEIAITFKGIQTSEALVFDLP
jgi:redox-sensitive bicupin YhaK (pirin superfamily)